MKDLLDRNELLCRVGTKKGQRKVKKDFYLKAKARKWLICSSLSDSGMHECNTPRMRGVSGVETCVFQYGAAATSRATRLSTTLSSKVNLPHSMNVRTLCGANLVTQPAKM